MRKKLSQHELALADALDGQKVMFRRLTRRLENEARFAIRSRFDDALLNGKTITYCPSEEEAFKEMMEAVRAVTDARPRAVLRR